MATSEFAHYATLHQLKQWAGVPNVIIFLCSDCLRHHESSKSSTNHSTMSLEDYKELPTVLYIAVHVVLGAL